MAFEQHDMFHVCHQSYFSHVDIICYWTLSRASMQYKVSGASSMHGAETALENSCSLNVKEILLAVADATQKALFYYY